MGNKNSKIEHKQEADGKYRIVVDGTTIGWITKWYKSDVVNKTGIKMFSAKPIGALVTRDDCESFKSAEAFILGYHEDYLKK